MGAHPSAPSAIAEIGTSLDILIRQSPAALLGDRCKDHFGDGLPFLLKLLAAERPLSIQAHPDKNQAEDGWKRENAAAVPLDAASRNYRDDNHKPEILCALTPFQALCGFRPVQEIRNLLDAFGASVLDTLNKTLNANDDRSALEAFLVSLHSLDRDRRRGLSEYALSAVERLCKEAPASAPLWRLVARLAKLEGGDPTIVAPLFLNYVELAPGEAVYLPAGVLHSYVGGFGVELMANSDNVLRGGLTKKHVDMDELLRVLRFEPHAPEVLKSAASDEDNLPYFGTPAAEFRLYEFAAKGEESRKALPESVPSIVVVIDGEFSIEAGDGEGVAGIAKGQSVFVAASAPTPLIRGRGLAYVASVPL
jgi:mannose-6-phosphate isomerase